MSTYVELINIITNAFVNNIKPQIVQIANLEIVKYVNTGDRVKDGSIVIIINVLFTLMLSIMYYLLSQINRMVSLNVLNSANNKYKINVKSVLKKITSDDVSKYLYKYELLNNCNELSFKNILHYLESNNVIDEVNITKQIEYNQFIRSDHKEEYSKAMKNKSMILQEVVSTTQVNYFMPIHVYTNAQGVEEYIFIHQGYIVSNSLIELNRFVVNVLSTVVETSSKSSASAGTIAGKILQIAECHYDPKRSSMETNILGELNPNITFENLHFDNKSIILEWLHKFSTNSMYPKQLPLANKLGILLYGPAGTGKTGTICAIANMLNRKILLIKSLTLKGQGQLALKQLLNNLKLSYVIVFDEIDYLLSNDDSFDENKEEESVYTEMFLNATTTEEKSSVLKMIEESKNKSNNSPLVDTKFILNLLDGIGNDTGRIIVATTNNPDKINPLFLRPGRFDVIIKLGYCSFNMFKDIVTSKYNELDDAFFETYKDKINEILTLNITPLVLINKLVISKDIHSMMEDLGKLKKQTYNSKIDV